MSEVLGIALATFVALLPIINPGSTAALFVSITRGRSQAAKHHQALMGCSYTLAILTASLVAGSLILAFFGISLSGLRIAGGLMVARMGLGLLRPDGEEKTSESGRKEARAQEDISFVPLAMPSMAGPGAIAVTIALAAEVNHWLDYLGIMLGIVTVTLVSWVALRTSAEFVAYMGENGLNAFGRIMGFLMLCVGVQFIVNGIVGVATDEAFLRAFAEAYQAAGG